MTATDEQNPAPPEGSGGDGRRRGRRRRGRGGRGRRGQQQGQQRQQSGEQPAAPEQPAPKQEQPPQRDQRQPRQRRQRGGGSGGQQRGGGSGGQRRRGGERGGERGQRQEGRSSRNSDRALVIIPTFNEAQNISKIVPRILQQHGRYDVLVVDDNSSDGTGRMVRDLARGDRRVHLIERPSKQGLGTAYVAGFRYALEHGFGYAFEMDADFSHNPKAINQLFDKAALCDLVIGSRYLSGVNVVNWPMRRLLLSYFANIYTRIVTGLPIKDATSGFKCYRREVLEAMDLGAIHSNGYAFQIETNFLAWKMGFRLGEVSIIFVDRRSGVSKMSKSIVYEAAWMVWKLKLKSLFLGKPRRAKKG